MRLTTHLSYCLILTLLIWSNSSLAKQLNIKTSEKNVVISSDHTDLLTYHTGHMPPPEGQPQHYARSGFIHPLNTLNGTTLSGIHPQDHIHHMGLWHAWVKTEFMGEERDFWNVDKQQAGIEFAELKEASAKDNTAVLKVIQNHFIYEQYPKVKLNVLEELLVVTLTLQEDHYTLDYSSSQTNVSAQTLELVPYRYGGMIAFRARHDWNKDNSDYLTDQGKTRIDGHATRANWVRLHGPGNHSDVSLSFLSHPNNFDSPQLVRIWDQGPVFFNYVPTQEKALSVKPGESIHMNYRIIVADEVLSAEKLNQLFQHYIRL
jgi:hypothetical protein